MGHPARPRDVGDRGDALLRRAGGAGHRPERQLLRQLGAEKVAPGGTWQGTIWGTGSIVRWRWEVEGGASSYDASICTTVSLGSGCDLQVSAK
jgi:hypothetical protein